MVFNRNTQSGNKVTFGHIAYLYSGIVLGGAAMLFALQIINARKEGELTVQIDRLKVEQHAARDSVRLLQNELKLSRGK